MTSVDSEWRPVFSEQSQSLLLFFVLSTKEKTGESLTVEEEAISLRAALNVHPSRTFQSVVVKATWSRPPRPHSPVNDVRNL
jgi:hypothetical protein